jgi:hypothetical protein
MFQYVTTVAIPVLQYLYLFAATVLSTPLLYVEPKEERGRGGVTLITVAATGATPGDAKLRTSVAINRSVVQVSILNVHGQACVL